MLPGWWSSVWEISGVQINWDCWSPYGVTLLFSFFLPFPNSTTGVSSFYPLLGYLTLSAPCWIFWSLNMLDPLLWALHSLSNSDKPWDLPLSWILPCPWIFFSSGSVPFPCLQFFHTGTTMGQCFDCGMATTSLIWWPIFLLEVSSISSLSLLSDISSKVPLRSLVHSGGSPQTYLLRLPVSILSAGPQGFSPFPSPNTRSCSPITPTLSTFLPMSLPPSRVGLRCPHLGTLAWWPIFLCVFCG